MHFLDRIPYVMLIVWAVFMSLAPFVPEPHLVEKVNMLMDGTLTKPIDIFDLFWHLLPDVLLVLKVVRDQSQKPEAK